MANVKRKQVVKNTKVKKLKSNKDADNICSFRWNIDKIFQPADPLSEETICKECRSTADPHLASMFYLVRKHIREDLKEICLRYNYGNPVSALSLFISNINALIDLIHQSRKHDTHTKTHEESAAVFSDCSIKTDPEASFIFARCGAALICTAELILCSEKFKIVLPEHVLKKSGELSGENLDIDRHVLETVLRSQAKVGYSLICATIKKISFTTLLAQIKSARNNLLQTEGFVRIEESEIPAVPIVSVSQPFEREKLIESVDKYLRYIENKLPMIQETVIEIINYGHLGATIHAYTCLFNIGITFSTVFNSHMLNNVRSLHDLAADQKNCDIISQLNLLKSFCEETRDEVVELISNEGTFQQNCHVSLRGQRLELHQTPLLRKCIEDIECLFKIIIDFCDVDEPLRLDRLDEQFEKYLTILSDFTKQSERHSVFINVSFFSSTKEYFLSVDS